MRIIKDSFDNFEKTNNVRKVVDSTPLKKKKKASYTSVHHSIFRWMTSLSVHRILIKLCKRELLLSPIKSTLSSVQSTTGHLFDDEREREREKKKVSLNRRKINHSHDYPQFQTGNWAIVTRERKRKRERVRRETWHINAPLSIASRGTTFALSPENPKVFGRLSTKVTR